MAKLGKLDEILVLGGDSSLDPEPSTQPEHPVKIRKVLDQVEEFRARTTGAEQYADISRRKLHQ